MTGARYALASDVAGEVIDGEAILIHLRTGIYYSLTGVGSATWQLLLSGTHGAGERAPARRDVRRRAGRGRRPCRRAPPARCSPRACSCPREEGAPDPVELPAGGAYEPPALQRYADMGDLLALDPPAPGIDDLSWSVQEPSSPEA